MNQSCGRLKQTKVIVATLLMVDVAQKLQGDMLLPAEDLPEDLPASSHNQQEETDDIQTITVEDNIYKAAETFEDLHLSPTLLQGLYTEMQFQRPSKIQAKTLPMILRPPFQSLIAQVSAEQGTPAYAEYD